MKQHIFIEKVKDVCMIVQKHSSDEVYDGHLAGILKNCVQRCLRMQVCTSEEVHDGNLEDIFVRFSVTYVRDQMKTLMEQMDGIIHIHMRYFKNNNDISMQLSQVYVFIEESFILNLPAQSR